MSLSKKSKLVLILSLLIVSSGLILMVILLLNNPNLDAWYKQYVLVKFNNILCATLIGAYFLLFQFYNNKSATVLLYGLSLSITAIGALTVLEYLLDVKTGVDQFFIKNKYDIASGDAYPGRMLLSTASVFLFFGLSLLGFCIKNRIVQTLSQYAMHAATLILAVLLTGFIYSDSLLHNLYNSYGFSYLYEGSLLFIMSLAASFLHPTLGITSLFTGNLVGNKMARRLFVIMAVAILLFGVVRIKYNGLKFWQFDTGFSIFITGVLLAALLIVWVTANWLNGIDLRRHKAEDEIKVLNEKLEQRVRERTGELSEMLEKYMESELKFRSLAEKSMVGIYISQNDKFVYVNPRFEEIFGYRPTELINMPGSPVDIIVCKEDRAMAREEIKKRYNGEIDNAHYQVRGLKKDGTQNHVEFFGSRVAVDGAKGIIGTVIDITERKKAEEELRSSEQKYKLLFESNPQPLWMIAKDDFSIISVNEAAANLYGYTQQELLNKNIDILRPAEDFDELHELFERELRGSANLGVVRQVKKDGAIMFVHIIAHDIVFDGRTVRLSLTTDVTEKIKAENNLQKSEANLRTILETTGTAYALLDRGLNIMAFNQVAVKFANLRIQNFPEPGNRLIDFIPEEMLPQFRNYADEVLKGKNINYEVNYPQAGGEVLFFSVRMFPIKNNEGEIFGLMLEVSDITEIKKYTNAIEEQNKKLREIAWFQSHIVRAPLARMMGIINLISDNDLDIAEQREFLKHLSTSAGELDAIIKDITNRTQEVYFGKVLNS